MVQFSLHLYSDYTYLVNFMLISVDFVFGRIENINLKQQKFTLASYNVTLCKDTVQLSKFGTRKKKQFCEL